MATKYKEFFVGVGLIAASFIPGLPGLVVTGLRLAGFGQFSSALAPASAAQRQDGVLATSIDPQNDSPIVYGTARLGPQLVWFDAYDVSGGLPRERLDIVAAYCLGNRVPQTGETADPDNGKIETFGTVFRDGQQAWDGMTQEDHGYPSTLNFVATTAYYHLGAHDQAADSYMVARNGPSPPSFRTAGNNTLDHPWSSSHQLQGVAYIVFALGQPVGDTSDAFFFGPFVPKTRPPVGPIPELTAMVKGRKLHDPRTDSWAFSDNWSLCVRDYLLDERSGCAVPLALLDDDTFADEADVSDEIILVTVEDDDGTQITNLARRYTVNGVVDTGQSVLRNLQELLFTAGGFLVWEQGQFRLKRMDEENHLHTLELDEHNIIGDWSLSTNDPGERANLVVANYIDGAAYDATTPKDRVLQAQFPLRTDTNTYVQDDDGFEVPKEIDLPFVTNVAQAVNRCEEELTRARNDLNVELTAKEEVLRYSLFDRVKLTHQTFGMASKEFFVTGLGINYDDTVRLGLREIDKEEGLIPELPPYEDPPSEEEFELGGKPLENVYADGNVWIGIVAVSGDTKPWAEIYDVTTDDTHTDLDYPSAFSTEWGWGMAYHPVRKEMWVLGTGAGGATWAVVYDTVTLAHKVSYSYQSDGYQATTPASIEYCPGNGRIFAAMRDTAGTDGDVATVVEIEPTTGAITREWSPATVETGGAGCVGQARAHVYSMVWDATDEVMCCALNLGNVWTIDPATGVHTQMSGPLEGLAAADTSDKVPEADYNSADGRTYALRDIYRDVYSYDTTPGGTCATHTGGAPDVTKFVNLGTSLADPGGLAVLSLPHLRAVAVSRGHSSVLYSDTQKNGRVTVYDLDGNVLRDFKVEFNPARMSYVPETDSICVVSYWNQDTQWFKQYLGLAGIRNPHDNFPPDQPSTPSDPAPTSEPEPDPTAPPADAPTITAARDYCTDGITEDSPGSDTYSGTIVTGVEVDYTDSASHPGAAVQVGVFPQGADPDNDGPTFSGGSAVDADTVRLQTSSKTVSAEPGVTRPACPGATNQTGRDAFDLFADVYIRHDLGGGSFSSWSNKVAIRIRNPAPLIPEDHPDDTDWPSDPSSVGAPIWASASTHCTDFASPVDKTEVYAILDALPANYGADGEGLLPLEFLEMNQGEVPGSDTPLRTQILSSPGRKRYTWKVYEVHDAAAQCGGPSSVPNLTRDYYCRHVVDGNGTRGPVSPVRSLTFVHPGPP